MSEASLVIGVAGLAVASSFVAGLLGAGGDILSVPLMLYVLPVLSGGSLEIHAITALTLVQSLASTGGGGVKHYLDGRVQRRALRAAAPPLAAGALVGGLLSRVVPGYGLLVAFALVTSMAAAFLLRREQASGAPVAKVQDRGATGLLVATGLLCGTVGVGGGFLIILILLYRMRMPMQVAKGTGLALTVCTAAPALAGKIATGQLIWLPVPAIAVAAVVGAVVGSRASAPLPAWLLRAGLAILVIVLAARVWITVAEGPS
jgi:uncharacterized membrane protein YfcA